jgi:hypothetical protein
VGASALRWRRWWQRCIEGADGSLPLLHPFNPQLSQESQMNTLKNALASLCVCAGVTPALSQVVPGGASPVNPSMPPSCAVVTAAEARSGGCALWSEATPIFPPTAALSTCSVLNLHPTKTVSGTIQMMLHTEFPIPSNLWIFNTPTVFAGLAPGAAANLELPVAVMIALTQNRGAATIYCRITLVPASALDHADARQVRTSMSVGDGQTGRIVSSSPLH